MRIRDKVDFKKGIPTNDEEKEIASYINATSSLILWAMCKDDKSTEWMKLFDGTELSQWLDKRDKFREKLNTNN